MKKSLYSHLKWIGAEDKIMNLVGLPLSHLPDLYPDESDARMTKETYRHQDRSAFKSEHCQVERKVRKELNELFQELS